MTYLSVNINKIATLRNARGGNNPDVLQVALDCERYGAQGITVHPRPDERHIRYADTRLLRKHISTELNIEGNPEPSFVALVLEVVPAQVTLVPDAPSAITSNAGYDTILHHDFLKKTIELFKSKGIRVSVFVDPDIRMIEGAAAIGADRVELYTEPYAAHYEIDRDAAVASYTSAAQRATELGLGLNAGHDLSLINLAFLKQSIPALDEVSIGHALICDALYYGLENTINMYKHKLK